MIINYSAPKIVSAQLFLMMSSIKCPLCNFNAPARSLWLSHLRSVHSEDDDFNITCGIDGCTNTYTKCSSFVTHIYRQHRESFVVQRPNASSSSHHSRRCDDEPPYELNEMDNGLSEESELQHAINQLLEIDQDVQRRKGALFILNLKEVRCLSESSIEHIVSETQKIFDHTIRHIKAGVNECIARSGHDPSNIPNLTNFFGSIEHPFNGLHSAFVRESSTEKNLDVL